MSSSTIDLTGNKRGAEEAEVQVEKKTKVQVEAPSGMILVLVTNENEINSYLADGIFEDVVGYQHNTSFVTEEMFKEMNERIRLEEGDSGYDKMPESDSDMKDFLQMYLPFLEKVETGHVSAATYVMYVYF